MIKIALAGSVLLTITTVTAIADSIDDRQLYQYGQIEKGRQDGSITWREGLRLRAEQQHISRMMKVLAEDGLFTKRNRRVLRQLQEEAAEHIEEAQYNDHYRLGGLPRVGR